jgi:hypothetical protein
MIQIFIILSLFFQENSITVVDFETKEPIPRVAIFYGDNKIETDYNGEFKVPNTDEDLRFASIGFHNVNIESIDITKIDTVFLFTCGMELGTRKFIIKNENIKRGKIKLRRKTGSYIYHYNRKDYSLSLKIENAL